MKYNRSFPQTTQYKKRMWPKYDYSLLVIGVVELILILFLINKIVWTYLN